MNYGQKEVNPIARDARKKRQQPLSAAAKDGRGLGIEEN